MSEQSPDMLERVARVLHPNAFLRADQDGIELGLEAARRALEASHHAELVEALRQTTEIIGVRYNADSAPVLERVERENRALLAKIGGEIDCPTCGGSGFSGQGTGYGDVCGQCGGTKVLAKIGGDA